MESNLLTAIFLPLALSIIMLGMGLSLSLTDFSRVVVTPRTIIAGLLIQIIGMPLLAFGIARGTGLAPELAVGLIIISVCPIGTISNLMVHLARGDTALSILLTALSSFLSVLTIPPFINAASSYFMYQAQVVHLPFWRTVLQIFLMIILPVACGMLIKSRNPRWAQKLETPLKGISLAFLLLIVGGAILKEKDRIPVFLLQAGTATFALNCGALLIGYAGARLSTRNTAESRALMIGTAMRNGTLGIALASSPALLGSPGMAIPAAIYSLLMFFTISVVVAWFRFRPSALSIGQA